MDYFRRVALISLGNVAVGLIDIPIVLLNCICLFYVFLSVPRGVPTFARESDRAKPWACPLVCSLVCVICTGADVMYRENSGEGNMNSLLVHGGWLGLSELKGRNFCGTNWSRDLPTT